MLFKNWPALLVPPSSGLATTAWTQSGTFSLIHLKFDTSIMALYLFAFLPKFLPKKLSPSASYILPASLLPFFSTHSHLTRQWRRAQHNPTQNFILFVLNILSLCSLNMCKNSMLIFTESTEEGLKICSAVFRLCMVERSIGGLPSQSGNWNYRN